MFQAVKRAVVRVVGRERVNSIVNPYHDWRAGSRSRRVLAGLPATGLRLHLGCGLNRLDGWVNLDEARNEAVDVVWDLRDGLPFPDDSAVAIFCEHVIEHMPKTVGEMLLCECRRVLETGGVARFSTPDAERYLRSYAGDREFLRHPGFSEPIETPLDRINLMMRENGQHLWAYDAESLAGVFCKAGFTQTLTQTYGVSAHPQMQGLDSPARAFESLYVEGVK
jgi:predicted SAM-dependent methyltransferase